MSAPSIFTRIIQREIPADIVFENDEIIAFTDIAPQAPVHLLVVPKTEQFANVSELAAGDAGLLSRVVAVAQALASEHADGEFRLVFNTGASAGQTVFHVHAHVLANEPIANNSLADNSLANPALTEETLAK
jgi:histidine triad (HIT) family protein